MTGGERAKQFMPFAALKGYEEAIREKDIECIQRAEESGILDEEFYEYLQRSAEEDI
jgi:hypothetical protein